VVDQFLARFKHVIVLDCIETETTAKAELALPAATFAEGDGTYVSSEGRAQRGFQTFVPPEPIEESWRWLQDWASLDDAIAELTRALPQFEGIQRAAPPATFRIAGQRIPREPHRHSGRTAVLANITVHEPKPPEDPDSPLAFSMEGYPNQPPPPLIPFFWAPAWNSIQAVNKFQSEVGGPLRGGDPGVRLIEAAGGAAVVFFAEVPSPFEARPGEWLLVPIYHIFGSEELSRWAPGVAELSPEPYVALNPRDASALGGEVECLGARLPVRPAPDLPAGIAGVPAGLAPFLGFDFPMWAGILKAP
jgi:NADH-quinone oxidoreductase subunit G